MKIKRSTLILWKKRLAFSLVIFFVFYSFYIFFRTSAFTITSYELIGVPDMYKETIENKLRVIASQPQYKILPSNRVLMYRKTAIKSAVVDVLPNSESVSLLPIGPHTLRVKVKSYEPFFKIDEVHGITKDGVIYTEFKDMSKLPKISFASSTTEEIIKDDIHSTKISGIGVDKLTNLSKLINKINSVIFIVSKIEIDGYGDITFYDEREISRIMFSGVTDTDKIWSNIVSAIDTDPLKSKILNDKDKLEYLDARFGNKVFYKFTNGNKTSIIQNHASTTASTTLSQ